MFNFLKNLFKKYKETKRTYLFLEEKIPQKIESENLKEFFLDKEKIDIYKFLNSTAFKKISIYLRSSENRKMRKALNSTDFERGKVAGYIDAQREFKTFYTLIAELKEKR